MKTMNVNELELVLRLSVNEDFVKFLEILRDSSYILGVTGAKMKDEVECRWNQGRMQELLDIIKTVKECKMNLDYAYSKQPRRP